MTCIHTECFQHFHLCFSEYATFFLAFISFKFLKNPLVQKIGNTCYRKCTASVCGFLVQTPCSKPNLKFLLYYFLTQVISDLILLVITFRWAAVKISCHWTPHWKSFVSSNRNFFFYGLDFQDLVYALWNFAELCKRHNLFGAMEMRAGGGSRRLLQPACIFHIGFPCTYAYKCV